ncbi:CTLH/CRA C-terminal to lish motif domain-containing protein [Auriculariales sp. MPI-PUGE-AT-0066]|nr:CTLH/CRA C-terminal to lish motif domain-containing protein [Auriculariales sp. MPI-PUGE-AT-0066]
MSSTKLNTEGMMLFEHSLPRAPYERLRHSFRAQQKMIDREAAALASAAGDLAKRPYDPTDALSTVDAMIARVEALKAKLATHHETATRPSQRALRARMNHIQDIESCDDRTDSKYSPWATTRLDRWLVDWSLRGGRVKTAVALAADRGIQDLADVDLFADISRIESALQSHSCTEALAWCSEHKVALRKAKSELEFELRLQEYIELCRVNRRPDAIAYLQKYLSVWKAASPSCATRIQQACGLLIYTSETTTCKRYIKLYEEERWSKLASAFRKASYELHALPAQPLLYYATYAGLSALKVPACATSTQPAPTSPRLTLPTAHRHAFDADDPMTGAASEAVGNFDCPVCDAGALGGLSQDVPNSHQAHSTLVCRLSGQVMDADNEPMLFPCGSVYSRRSLEDMAAKNDGLVTCPRTGEVVLFSNLRKVFIS